MIMTQELLQSLRLHEGYRPKPYTCTMGKLTIGYGTLIEQYKHEHILMALFNKGISQDQALEMLKAEVYHIETFLSEKTDWFKNQPDTIKAVITEMAYQLGIGVLSTFKNFAKAIRNFDYETAAKEMLYKSATSTKWSDWHTQTPKRCEALAMIVSAQATKT